MHFLIAPDKFKGSLTAGQAARYIAQGLEEALPGARVMQMPLSDGGEGLAEVLLGQGRGSVFESTVLGPLGRPVQAKWGILKESHTAVIEMAQASGLALLKKEEFNPALTTTFGTGQLIRAALDQGCTQMIVGIGGSATNDAGAGLLQALGVSFKDSQGQELGFGGAHLKKLARLDLTNLDQRLKKTKIKVACDVQNPLFGAKGASLIYGPQKGASPKMALELDQAFKHFALVVKNQLAVDLENISCAGAAGGLGAGLFAFLRAELTPGIELVLEALHFDQKLEGCALVMTGEGSLDGQSLQGKTPMGVARRAAKHKVPVIALAGRVSGPLASFHQAGFTACFAIADGPLSLEESMTRAPVLLKNKAAELLRFWSAAKTYPR